MLIRSIAKGSKQDGQAVCPGAGMDPVSSENIRSFFEHIKNAGLSERIFSWRQMQSQGHDASAEYHTLLAHILKTERELARLGEKNRELMQTECQKEVLRLQEELSHCNKVYKKEHEKLLHFHVVADNDLFINFFHLKGYLGLIKKSAGDPGCITDLINKAEMIVDTSLQELKFCQKYWFVDGVPPSWQNIVENIGKAAASFQDLRIKMVIDCHPDLEVYADPMLEKVFFNFIDKSVRHGERATLITVSCRQEPAGLILTVEDNGVGIPDKSKEEIFRKAFREAGFGLFLVREILAVTGIAIRETGIYGKCARFEIMVPEGGYRFTPRSEYVTKGAEDDVQESCPGNRKDTVPLDTPASEHLCSLFDRIKNAGFFERIFSWQKVWAQGNEVFAEYQKIQAQIKKKEQDLSILAVKNGELLLETENQKKQISDLQRTISIERQLRESLYNKIRNMEPELATMEKKLADSEGEILRLKQETAALTKTNEDLRRRIIEQENEAGGLTASDSENMEPTPAVKYQREIVRLQQELGLSRETYEKEIRRLNLFSSITRYDVLNQCTILDGYLSLTEIKVNDPQLALYISKGRAAAQAIQQQISSPRSYQYIGVIRPVWQNVNECTGKTVSNIGSHGVSVTVNCSPDLEILADPMLENVFATLLDTSLRYGERVKEIRVSSQNDEGGLVIAWEDDGVGFAADQKEKIFVRLRQQRFDLGLSREVLEITGITIRETGTYGKGARFEMRVPEGAYRFTAGSDAGSG
jgi:signal transduction histidine kinase